MYVCLFQSNHALLLLFESVADIAVRQIKPFFDTPLTILGLTYRSTTEIFFKVYTTLKEKSVISMNFQIICRWMMKLFNFNWNFLNMPALIMIFYIFLIVWAIDYFSLPSYFYNGMLNLSKGIAYLIKMLEPENRIVGIEFTTGRILEWKSFREVFKANYFYSNEALTLN